MIRTLMIVAAALGMVSGIHEQARGQAKLDGIYAGELAASGRCAFERAEVNVTIQGSTVTGFIASPQGRAQFTGKLDGNTFSLQAIGQTGERLTVDGRVAANGASLDVRVGYPQCTVQGELDRKA